MFRSPPKLRSGARGQPVSLSTTDKRTKVHRSLSVSSASCSSTDQFIMPGDKGTASFDPIVVEHCVNKYLSGEEVFNRLVTKLTEIMTTVVETAVRSALTAANRELALLREEVSGLTEKVAELGGRLTDRTDELEQYQRRDNIRIFGLEETKNEDTDRLVVDLCRERLGIEVSLDSISRSHRVGRQPTSTGDRQRFHRPIIVRFTGYRDRQRVFNNKKNLKGSGITIREDLTVRRLAVFRKAVEKYGARSTWTQDGRVLWVDKDGKRGAATRLADLTSVNTS